MVCPLVCGWNAVLSRRSMRKQCIRFAHNREVKSDPRSDIIAEDTACNRITSRVMNYANFPAVMSERQGMCWHILESLSTTTRIASYLPPYAILSCSPVIKSMEKRSHDFVGIRRGWGCPGCFPQITLAPWQIKHEVQYASTCLYMLSQKYLWQRVLYVFFVAKWPAGYHHGVSSRFLSEGPQPRVCTIQILCRGALRTSSSHRGRYSNLNSTPWWLTGGLSSSQGSQLARFLVKHQSEI